MHKLAAIADFGDAADLYDKLTSVDRPPARPSVAARRQPARLPSVEGAPASFMLADTIGYLPDDILVKVDRAAMAASPRDARPHARPRVDRLAWSLPAGATSSPAAPARSSLRRLLGRCLPAELWTGRRWASARRWPNGCAGRCGDWAEDLLAPDALRRQGFLEVDSVRQTWERHCTGRRDHTREVWHLLMFQAWLTEWRGAR